jgi:hypothetical protein
VTATSSTSPPSKPRSSTERFIHRPTGSSPHLKLADSSEPALTPTSSKEDSGTTASRVKTEPDGSLTDPFQTDAQESGRVGGLGDDVPFWVSQCRAAIESRPDIYNIMLSEIRPEGRPISPGISTYGNTEFWRPAGSVGFTRRPLIACSAGSWDPAFGPLFHRSINWRGSYRHGQRVAWRAR